MRWPLDKGGSPCRIFALIIHIRTAPTRAVINSDEPFGSSGLRGFIPIHSHFIHGLSTDFSTPRPAVGGLPARGFVRGSQLPPSPEAPAAPAACKLFSCGPFRSLPPLPASFQPFRRRVAAPCAGRCPSQPPRILPKPPYPMTFSQIPPQYAPLGAEVPYAVEHSAAEDLDIRITDRNGSTLYGTLRFVASAAARFDAAPFLRRALHFPARGERHGILRRHGPHGYGHGGRRALGNPPRRGCGDGARTHLPGRPHAGGGPGPADNPPPASHPRGSARRTDAPRPDSGTVKATVTARSADTMTAPELLRLSERVRCSSSSTRATSPGPTR